MASNKHLYRRLYPHRIVGLGFAALAVGTVLWQHAAPAAHWGVVVAMLAWPHLAFGLARAAANPFRVERRNLIVDTVLVGVSLPLMSFSLLPSVILVLVALFDRVNLGVRRLARDALIGVVASAAVATLLLRPGLALESPLPVVLACLPLLAVHMLSVSLGMNRYVQIVVRQNRELETAHRTDQQTSLFTRAHWMTLAEEALADVRARKTSAAVFVIDLDRFKQINDTHGHLVGDAVITAASLAIRQSLRQEDAAGRYGGDEFTVLCRGTTPAEAEGLAQRLHERIAAIRVRQVPDLVVGSSIGVAMASPDHADMQDWLHSADEALYRSKRQGRGRISFDGAVPGAA